MSSVFGTVRGDYGYGGPAQRYYPGTYIEEHPSYTDRKAYRTYAGEYRRDGFDYVTTREPFQPEHDYYYKEHKRPYYYRDNRLYHTRDPVRKYYDGDGNVTVTVIDGGGHNEKRDREYAQYTSTKRHEEPQSIRTKCHKKESEEHEVGYLVEHLASFDVGDDYDPDCPGQSIELAVEALRNMERENAILPLRCYLTYKDEEIQVLSDKELTVLEWIKYDDVNLLSAEVNQFTRYDELLLVQVRGGILHLFYPLGDGVDRAKNLAKSIKGRVSKRKDTLDEQRDSHWEEDRSNNRYLLNDETIRAEPDVDFYDKYTMQLYGRAKRDYVARNDKELTVMIGESVEIQSTRGQWWLARLSNGKSGYVPSDCLESYVPRPAGLPRTTLGERGRSRDVDTVSERGSTYSVAASRYRESGRDYRDGRHDRDYNRRDRDDHRGYDRRRDNFDNISYAPRQGFGTGLQGGLGSGFGTGLNGLGTGLNGLGTGLNGLGTGLNGLGTGLNGLGTAALSPGLTGNGLGNGFGTIGPAGFSTVPSATAAGLFPQGFTTQLHGRPVPLAGSVRGNPLLGAQSLGNSPLGSRPLGFPAVGAPPLSTPPLGTPLGITPTLGATTFGAANLSAPTLGTAAAFGNPALSLPTLGNPIGTPGLGRPNLGNPRLF